MSNLGSPALRALQSPYIVPHARAPYTVPCLPHLSIASTKVVKCNRWLYARRIWKLMTSALERRSLCNMLSLLIVLRKSVVARGFPVEPGYSCQKQICLRSLKVSRKGIVQKTTEDDQNAAEIQETVNPQANHTSMKQPHAQFEWAHFSLTHRDQNLSFGSFPSFSHSQKDNRSRAATQAGWWGTLEHPARALQCTWHWA